MQAFTLHTTPHIVFEPGGIRRLGEIAGDRLGERVLLVTDPGLRQAGLVIEVVDALTKSGATVEVYDEVEEDPSRATVEAAAAMAVECGAIGIVGFGGGSSMDVAKLVAALAGGDQPLDEMWGLDQVRRRVLPLVPRPRRAPARKSPRAPSSPCPATRSSAWSRPPCCPISRCSTPI